MVNIENCHTYLLQFLRYAWNFLGQTYDFSLYTGGIRCMNSRLFCGMSPKLGARSSNYTCDDVGFQILKPPRLVCLHDSNIFQHIKSYGSHGVMFQSALWCHS